MLVSVRKLVYKMGFRPKYGTVLFSPSLDLYLAAKEAFENNVDWTKVIVLTDGCEIEVMNNCEICGKPDSEKPTCFRGERWCCEKHRKLILGDSPVKRY